jgi:hypothetical protein
MRTTSNAASSVLDLVATATISFRTLDAATARAASYSAPRRSTFTTVFRSWTLPWSTSRTLPVVSLSFILINFVLFIHIRLFLDSQDRFNIAKDLRSSLEVAYEGLAAQHKLVDSLSSQFLDAFAKFKASMDDPMIVLRCLAGNEEHPVAKFSYDQFALLATVFKWNSKLNFSEVDTGSKTISDWLELVRDKASALPEDSPSSLAGPSTNTASLFSPKETAQDVGMEEAAGAEEGEDELDDPNTDTTTNDNSGVGPTSPSSSS